MVSVPDRSADSSVHLGQDSPHSIRRASDGFKFDLAWRQTAYIFDMYEEPRQNQSFQQLARRVQHAQGPESGGVIHWLTWALVQKDERGGAIFHSSGNLDDVEALLYVSNKSSGL